MDCGWCCRSRIFFFLIIEKLRFFDFLVGKVKEWVFSVCYWLNCVIILRVGEKCEVI